MKNINKMKLKNAALLVIGLLPMAVIAQPAPTPSAPPARPPQMMGAPMGEAPPAVMPEKGKLSYAIGMYFGNNITNQLKRGGVEVDTNIVLKALTDLVTGKPTEMTETEQRGVLTQLRQALQAKQRAEAEENKAKGDAYLAKFAKEPGVVTLTNGLEYKVIKDGTGPMPKETESVVMGYKGTLIDGTEFDHNESFSTPVKGRTIRGWQEILPLMKQGSEWQVVIPPNLAYGPRGNGKIPGNSVLIFDMELKSITPAGPTLPPMNAGKPTASATPANGSSTPVVSGEIIKVPSAEELKKGAKIEVIKDGQTNAAQ